MKGRGNSFSTLFQKLYFKMIPIGSFDKLVEKRKTFNYDKSEIERIWTDCNKKNGAES